MDNTKTKPEGISGFSDFSIKDYIQACKSRWQWILLSLIICVGAGVLYILCQQPEYQRTEEVLIKDQEGDLESLTWLVYSLHLDLCQVIQAFTMS